MTQPVRLLTLTPAESGIGLDKARVLALPVARHLGLGPRMNLGGLGDHCDRQ